MDAQQRTNILEYINVKFAQQGTTLNTLKWIVVAILLIAGVVANSYFAAQPAALRLVGWLVLLGVVVLIASQTKEGRWTWGFFQDARMELRKVVWPTRQETVQTTLLVILMVAVTAAFLWCIDTTLLWLVGLLTTRAM